MLENVHHTFLDTRGLLQSAFCFVQRLVYYNVKQKKSSTFRSRIIFALKTTKWLPNTFLVNGLIS